MNYSQKNSADFFSKIIGGTLKAGAVLAAAFLICGNSDFTAEADKTTAEPATVELPQVLDTPCPLTEISDEGFKNPTEQGVLTSAFGERWGRTHKGIDIGADLNTEIYAADDGIITYAGEMGGYGNYVTIDHENGFETAYAHCNSIAVYVGQSVKKGDVIAYVGSTGNSTGPHLHFEVRENGEYLNPLDFVVY